MFIEKKFDLVIVGGGILGTSLSYFASGLNDSIRVAVVEQAQRVAFHTSGRNTGKIHAPYLYNPAKKKLFAKAAFLGYDMWEKYSGLKNLPFQKDGVIEVAVEDGETGTLEKYLRWGKKNGLKNKEIELVDGPALAKIEPEVRCSSALVVRKEGSTDYARLTQSLMEDSMTHGTVFLLGTRVVGFKRIGDGWELRVRNSNACSNAHTYNHGVGDTGYDGTIRARFLINAAGGESVDVAHSIGLSEDLTDVHFRGEYWRAPTEYHNLTKTSIYSVPEFPDYPFLDPHWIVRVDRSCEIGPNAVPVFGPYAYDRAENIREFLPKTIELLGSGAVKTIFDKQFQNLVFNEVHSSVSKSAMVNRVRRFLPRIDANRIAERGTAGIRSSVINSAGKFVPDVVLVDDDDGSSFHILNYNSPGATGVLPFSVHIIERLCRAGCLDVTDITDVQCGPWKLGDVVQSLGGV